jgi:hypothetical protein
MRGFYWKHARAEDTIVFSIAINITAIVFVYIIGF